MLRRKNPWSRKAGGRRGPGHPQTGGTSVTSPGIPARLPSIPGWGTGLGGFPFPGGFPLSLRGPHPPGGSHSPHRACGAPRCPRYSSPVPAPHSSSGSPLPGGVPFSGGRSPVSPGPPRASSKCWVPAPPAPPPGPPVPTHLAALAGAHPVVVPGAAVAAHEARLVHAGGGRWRGGARVPQNPPRGGLQGWGEKGGGVKQPLSAPLQRGPIHEAQVGWDFGGLAVTSMALKSELQTPKIGGWGVGGLESGGATMGGSYQRAPPPLRPPQSPKPGVGVSPAPPNPKILEKEGPQPPQIRPAQCQG